VEFESDRYLLFLTGDYSDSPDIVYCNSMREIDVQKLVECVRAEMSLRQKKCCLATWHQTTFLSLQNHTVFAPPPGKYSWPKRFYAVSRYVDTKVKSRHRKKKRLQARNR
jgi:hypothetical protein